MARRPTRFAPSERDRARAPRPDSGRGARVLPLLCRRAIKAAGAAVDTSGVVRNDHGPRSFDGWGRDLRHSGCETQRGSVPTMTTKTTAEGITVSTTPADEPTGDDELVMALLQEHVPLALLCDLSEPEGPTSAEILEVEGVPAEHWWEQSPSTSSGATALTGWAGARGSYHPPPGPRAPRALRWHPGAPDQPAGPVHRGRRPARRTRPRAGGQLRQAPLPRLRRRALAARAPGPLRDLDVRGPASPAAAGRPAGPPRERRRVRRSAGRDGVRGRHARQSGEPSWPGWVPTPCDAATVRPRRGPGSPAVGRPSASC